jgi:SNF2 family DNA or RNA helicase
VSSPGRAGFGYTSSSKGCSYVIDRQQAGLPGYCRDVPPPPLLLEQQQQQQTPGAAAALDPVSAALAAAAGLSTPQQLQQQQQQQRESPSKALADPQQQQQLYSSFPRVVQSPLPPLWHAVPPPPPLLPLPPLQPLAAPLLQLFGSAPPSQPYALAKALCDSGKLTALDQLLVKLKAEGHRVLVFCQVG